MISFADLADDALALRSQLEEITKRAVPMLLLTNSKPLFEIISKGSRTSEKRIMLDILAARESHKLKEISNIGFVRSSSNLADVLTKGNMQEALFELLATGTHTAKCQLWILKN